MQHFRRVSSLQEDFRILFPDRNEDFSSLILGLQEDIGQNNELAKSIQPPMQFPIRSIEDAKKDYRNAVDSYNKKQFSSEAEEKEAWRSIEEIENSAKELEGFKPSDFSAERKQMKSESRSLPKHHLVESFQKGERVKMLSGGLKGTIVMIMSEPDGGVRYQIKLDNGENRIARAGMFDREDVRESEDKDYSKMEPEDLLSLAHDGDEEAYQEMKRRRKHNSGDSGDDDTSNNDYINFAALNLLSPTHESIKKTIVSLCMESKSKSKHKKKPRYKKKIKVTKKYIKSGVGSLANIAESLIKSHSLLSEEKLNRSEMIQALESIKSVASKVCKQGAQIETISPIWEKYMGFEKLTRYLAAKGARNPNALAAWIGRKKYGKEGMAKKAAAGKKESKQWWTAQDIKEAIALQHVILRENEERSIESFKTLKDAMFFKSKGGHIIDPSDNETIMSHSEILDWFSGDDQEMSSEYYESSSPEEKKLGYDLDYVGTEWDELEDWEDEGDDIKDTYDLDLTHVGEEWDDLEDEDEEGSEVKDQNKDDKDYVGAQESIMIDLRSMTEDCDKLIQGLKENRINAKAVQPILAKMAQYVAESAKNLVRIVENEFKYVGQDAELNQLSDEPESPKTNKYVGQDNPEEEGDEPVKPVFQNKYVGQDSEPNEESGKQDKPKANKYVGQDDTLDDDSMKLKSSKSNKYVGQDDKLDDDSDEGKPEDKAEKKYVGQDDPSKTSTSETPVQNKGAGEVSVIESKKSIKEDEFDVPVDEPTLTEPSTDLAPAAEPSVIDAEPAIQPPRDKRAIIREMEFVLREASKIADPKPGYGVFDPEAVVSKGKEEVYSRYKSQWDSLVAELHADQE